jgi:hypothetical protein
MGYSQTKGSQMIQTLDILQLTFGFVLYFLTSVLLAGTKKYTELYATDLYKKNHE